MIKYKTGDSLESERNKERGWCYVCLLDRSNYKHLMKQQVAKWEAPIPLILYMC